MFARIGMGVESRSRIPEIIVKADIATMDHYEDDRLVFKKGEERIILECGDEDCNWSEWQIPGEDLDYYIYEHMHWHDQGMPE